MCRPSYEPRAANPDSPVPFRLAPGVPRVSIKTLGLPSAPPSFLCESFSLNKLFFARFAALVLFLALLTPGLPAYPLLQPAAIESTREAIRMTARIDPAVAEGDKVAWVLAAPEGEYEVRWHRFVLRSSETGERMEFATPEEVETITSNSRFVRALTIADLGTMRRVRLLAVRLEPDEYLMLDGVRYVFAEFDLEVRFAEQVPTPRAIDDPAFTDPTRSFRRMIDLSVCNPDAIDLYAQPDPLPTPDENWEEATWQPRPELSPGFPWLRIPVSETRFYTIDGRWLAMNGIDAGSIDPASLRLVTRGEEVPLIRMGPADAGFTAGARLVFWGQRNDSRETPERVYYLGVRAAGEQSPVFAEATAAAEAPVLQRFRRVYRVEEDATLQTKLGSFLSIREMNWVWHRLANGEPFTAEFVTQGLPEPIPAAKGRVLFYTGGRGLTGLVTVRIALNGEVVEEGLPLKTADQVLEFDVPAGLLRHERNSVELTLQVSDAALLRRLPPIYVDALEFETDSLFKAEDGRLEIDFARTEEVSGPRQLDVVGFRAKRLLAMDITDPSHPVRLPVIENDTEARVLVTLGESARVLLVEDDVIERAPQGKPSEWTDLHADNAGADVVVLTHALFAAQAAAAAEDIRTTGRTVEVLDVDRLYESHSYGEVSTDAIRAFLREALASWRVKPESVLLIGDCTSDGQNVARNEVVNFLPTRVSDKMRTSRGDEFCSDAYFGWLAGDDEIADLFVARYSVATVEAAEEVVRKSAAYRRQGTQEWASSLFFVSDPSEFRNAVVDIRDNALAPWIDAQIVNTADHPWEDNFYLPAEIVEGEEIKVSPIVTRRIQQAFEEGTGIISFVGHGSPNIWSNQRIWFGGDSENSDNLRLTNAARLPFVTTFTCNNGAIDYPMPRWNISIIEDMMRVTDGGTIGAWVPSGPGFATRHKYLAAGLLSAFGEHNVRELGMLSEMSRLTYQAVQGVDDHSRMYLLLGDPTLQIPAARPILTVASEPEILTDSTEPQQITLAVSSDERLTSMTATLQTLDGEVLARIEGQAPEPAEALAIPMEVTLPVNVDAVRAVVRARDAQGRLHAGGLVIERGPAKVLIASADQTAVDMASTTATISYVLENESGFAAQTTLIVDRLTGDSRVEVARLDVEIPAHDRLLVPVAVTAPHGAWVLEARVTPQPAGAINASAPSALLRSLAVIADGTGRTDVAFAPEAFRLLPARSRTSQPLVETFVANLGEGTPLTRIQWTLRYPDGNVVTGERVAGRVGPGASLRVEVPVRMEMQMAADLTVELTGESDAEDDADLANNVLSHVLTADGLPDMRIVPGSVRVSPNHLAEGLTVFVDAEVENIGNGPSFECKAGLYAAGDEGYRETLRTIPGQLHDAIPSLAPGERWPVRLRWDPVGNLDTDSIQLVADSEAVLAEPDKQNNRVSVPVDIKSKWDLQARGVRLARGRQPGTVVLIATIGNAGETDAQRVSVWFYADSEQNDETYLGEVLVERVPAGDQVLVPFVWNLEGVDVQAKRRPSFSMALKGSLQRISSASD
ncbi:MAG: hypothetical protein PWP23_2708 [Candidatus Sumerlaeota bacterium]|nr:hypothetical protein [Candidatus Sumerlaeota bacterium]